MNKNAKAFEPFLIVSIFDGIKVKRKDGNVLYIGTTFASVRDEEHDSVKAWPSYTMAYMADKRIMNNFRGDLVVSFDNDRQACVSSWRLFDDDKDVIDWKLIVSEVVSYLKDMGYRVELSGDPLSIKGEL